MSPLYEYKCKQGHTTSLIRSYDHRLELVRCPTCGGATEYQFPLPHALPDGVYSYAPNLGNPEVFEKRVNAIDEGAYARKHGIKQTPLRNRSGDPV